MKTMGEIAGYVGGELRGDPGVVIARVIHPALVQGSQDLALVLSAGVLEALKRTGASNAILPAELGGVEVPNCILVSRPRLALARLLELFELPAYVNEGVHPTAVIDSTARLGNQVRIGPHCWVGPNSMIGDRSRLICNVCVGADVQVGEQTVLYAGVSVGDRCNIGSRAIIQPNASIGGDGFSYVTPEPGSVESARQNLQSAEVTSFNKQVIRINSIGRVVIEDEVEIGAGACIDRGTLGETRIGRGTKIDNLVQVGHNVVIGQNCLIVAQVGMAGSVTVGDRVVMGGQVGVADHLTIGDDAVIVAQAGVAGNVPPRQTYIFAPAMPRRDYLQQQIHFKRLPRLNERVKELEQKVAELEKRLAG
jgi:UDP-3-O-[3-hydroxymyristoyl] glucosamine N-acyltransferase